MPNPPSPQVRNQMPTNRNPLWMVVSSAYSYSGYLWAHPDTATERGRRPSPLSPSHALGAHGRGVIHFSALPRVGATRQPWALLRNRVAVGVALGRLPRVGATRQPWALLHNRVAVGVALGRLPRVGAARQPWGLALGWYVSALTGRKDAALRAGRVELVAVSGRARYLSAPVCRLRSGPLFPPLLKCLRRRLCSALPGAAQLLARVKSGIRTAGVSVAAAPHSP